MDISRLSLLAVSDTGFVFDPRTGHSYTVNATGLRVLRDLRKGQPISATIAEFQDSYDSVGNLESDLRAFAEALSAYELIDSSEQGRAIP